MRVLGIDPGTRRLGWAVVERAGTRVRAVAQGVLDVSKLDSFEERLVALARGIEAVIAEHAPTTSAIERVFSGKNVATAIKAAEGRGAVRLTLARAGLEVNEYAAREIKLAVTGRGGAAKPQVAAMVRTIAAITAPLAEDAADALAVAICHLHRAGRVGGPPTR